MKNIERRTIHPQIKVLDAKQGMVEYVASDESIDSYREIIRASGWRFTHFKKNAPFVDSHNYESVDRLLGKVVEFKVAGNKLVETVQWAIDVAENKLAQFGFKMVANGYLPAVSVGFIPSKWVGSGDGEPFQAQLQELGMAKDAAVRRIFTEQEQVELSAVILPANPNSLVSMARAFKAGVLDDAAINFISQQISHETTSREHADRSTDPADDRSAQQRARAEFMGRFEKALKGKNDSH